MALSPSTTSKPERRYTRCPQTYRSSSAPAPTEARSRMSHSRSFEKIPPKQTNRNHTTWKPHQRLSQCSQAWYPCGRSIYRACRWWPPVCTSHNELCLLDLACHFRWGHRRGSHPECTRWWDKCSCFLRRSRRTWRCWDGLGSYAVGFILWIGWPSYID